MIAKVQTKEGWIFFDYVDRFEIYEQQRQTDDAHCPTQVLLMNEGSKFIKVIWLFKNGEAYQRLKVDDSQVYLLNDEGKTIERIN